MPKQVSFSAPKELMAAIVATAQFEGRSVSNLVCRAVEQYIARSVVSKKDNV